MTPLRWAVVGCGWVGRDLAAPAIDECAGAELVALCDDDQRRLDAAASRFPGAVSHRHVTEVLRDDAVEAVYVATPNHTHGDLVRAAAAAGRHVLCEKPMATTAADAAAMLDACQRAGVAYATAFDQRYHAAHRRLRAIVGRGDLGTVTLARVHYACWLGDDWSPWTGTSKTSNLAGGDGAPSEAVDNWRIDADRAGGGALIDLAPHSIDLLPYLLGDEWAQLIALEQRCVHGYDVPDGAVLSGRLSSGALASISVSYNCPELLPRRRLELYGTLAMAEAVDTMGQTAGGRLTFTDAIDGRRTDVPIAPDDDRSPFLAQVEAFGHHVRSGERLPVDAATDVRHVELLEAAIDRAAVPCR